MRANGKSMMSGSQNKLKRKGSMASSVSGPPSWKSTTPNRRFELAIPQDPKPKSDRMLPRTAILRQRATELVRGFERCTCDCLSFLRSETQRELDSLSCRSLSNARADKIFRAENINFEVDALRPCLLYQCSSDLPRPRLGRNSLCECLRAGHWHSAGRCESRPPISA